MEKGRKGERNSFDFTFQQALNGRVFQANLGEEGDERRIDYYDDPCRNFICWLLNIQRLRWTIVKD